MKAVLSRAMMALAVCCLGDHRREWARAMEVEFEAASEDGSALDFAIGCLIGAVREMPAHAEGRFVLASYALAIGLVVPMATLLILGVVLGLPYLYPWHVRFDGLLAGTAEHVLVVTQANHASLPSLAVIVLLLGVGHFRVAWLILERDWTRVANTARLLAAATATLVAVTGVLVLADTRAWMQAAVLAAELAAISALARWHAQLDQRPLDGARLVGVNSQRG